MLTGMTGIIPSVDATLVNVVGATDMIIPASKLGDFTARGWQAIIVIKRACTEARDGSVVVPGYSSNNPNQYGCAGSLQHGTIVQPAEEILVHVRRSREDAAKDERTECERLDGVIALEKLLTKTAEANLAKASEESRALTARIDVLEKELPIVHEQLTAYRSKATRYEADMAKLRKEIGEGRAREILGQ